MLKLIEAGAKPEIDFDTWLKSAKFSFDKHLGNFESNQAHFRKGTDQPLISAISSDHPEIALDLLNRGADPNVLTKASWEVVTHEWARRYHTGRAALDVARDSLSRLRKYRGETTDFKVLDDKSTQHPVAASAVDAPKGPIDADKFLAKFSEDTYQHWVVSKDIKYRMKLHKEELERFEKNFAEKANAPGLKQKQEAIDDLISQFEKVVAALEAKGAKTFREQYPDIENKIELASTAEQERAKQTPYEFLFDFNQVKDLTEARKAAYVSL